MKGIKEKKERDSSWDSQDQSNKEASEAARESIVKSSRSGGSVKSSSAYDKYNLASSPDKQASASKHGKHRSQDV